MLSLEIDLNPEVFITNSTKDDGIHPGHGRKWVTRLKSIGANEVHYHESIGASDNKQRAILSCLAFRFLWKSLKVKVMEKNRITRAFVPISASVAYLRDNAVAANV